MRIEIILDDPRVFETGRKVILTMGGLREYGEIEFLRKQHERYVLKLRGIDTIAQAERLVHWEVSIAEADLPAAPEGRFYTFHLKGCQVMSAEGEFLGQVVDVLGVETEPEGTPVLQVEGPLGEILIPLAAQYVKSVDLENGQIVAELPQELRDLNA